MATLKPGSPYNEKLFVDKRVTLARGGGETYYDTTLNRIAEHPLVSVLNEGGW